MSSAPITSIIVIVVLLALPALAHPPRQASSGAARETTANSHQSDPAQIFQRGQEDLAAGRLDEAERRFQQVLQLDPQAGAAYANLGVISMRRKQWTKALESLEKAERLMPLVPGIRLNIGLAYYRQNEFLKAIPSFESVVRDQPNASQPRYLLGLSYFFADRWAESASVLAPLWAQESGHFPYLYVLANAAHRAGKKELDDRATEQLLKLGNDSPEYHLFAGKYHLNLDQYDLARGEFQAAAKADPRFPFVHFNLGLVDLKKQEYSAARDEFMEDAKIEPDLALNYDELGEVYWMMQDDANAEKSYREALRRDPRLVSSILGLAKIYQRQQKYAAALAETDAAVKFDPARPDAHYLRAQVLLHMGRKQQAREEMAAVARAEKAGEKSERPVPSPELLQDSQ